MFNVPEGVLYVLLQPVNLLQGGGQGASTSLWSPVFYAKSWDRKKVMLHYKERDKHGKTKTEGFFNTEKWQRLKP